MDDKRFSKMETRVDEIKDDVAELKADSIIKTSMISGMREDLREHSQIVKHHVMGDDKIITQIMPVISVLPHLAEMVEDHKYKKESSKRTKEFMKEFSMKIGLISLFIGTVSGIVKVVFDL